MWIYFLERENERVVVLSDQPLLDATRETQIAGIEWLAEVVKGWHCGIEERPEAQPLSRYEDIFNKQKRRTPKRNTKKENESPPQPPKPLPHQRWVWGKKNFAEGTVKMIIEEVLKRGLFVEFLTSKLGQELMSYYGEALRDLVRKKIRGL
jgi:hypothetical protein